MPADVAKIKELFLALLEKTGPQRTALLDTGCAGDADLRRRLETMLRTHETSGELLRDPAELLAEVDAGRGATADFSESSATTGDADLSFLAPATKPGDLGRLGHYEVREVLGRGGFGIVLKAFDDRLHRIVAIKALAPAYAANGSARKRFIREARAAAAVKNEHVVGIYDVQENSEPPYLVMECIDGINLQDKLDKHGPLGVKEVLRIGMQIAEGLVAAHKQGLVHRDIKPANILLENGVERVKITDFGLARAVDDASVTQSGAVPGTPMYMSPEQAEGLPIDHRSDLFSLGTVMYAMCTGHPPFRATGTLAVLKRVIEAASRPIREINDEIPDWLAAIIAKLHAKKPEDRFQTAREVADLLGQKLADVQSGRKAPTAAVPKPASLARSRVGAAVFLLSLAVLSWSACFSILWFRDSGRWLAAVESLAAIAGLGLVAAIAIWESRRRPLADLAAAASPASSPKQAADDWSRPRRVAALAFLAIGIFFAIKGAILFTLPAEQLRPAGGQWLMVALGAASFYVALLVVLDPTRRRWATRGGVAVLLAVLAVLWFGRFLFLSAMNEAEVTFVPEPGFNSAIVLQNDVVVNDWMNMKSGRSVMLSPGKYLVNGGTLTGYRLAGWEMTTSGPFGSSAVRLPAESCVVNVARGEHVTLRAVLARQENVAAVSMDQERIQGKWLAAPGPMEGDAVPDALMTHIRAVDFVGGTMRIEMQGGKSDVGTFHLNENGDPKQIHFVSDTDRRVRSGIYRLDGDRLAICLGEGTDRPTEFTSKTGTRRLAAAFRRAGTAPVGWVSLFNGKDTAGWTTLFDPKVWRVNNGILEGGGNKGYLVSEREYDNFHFRVEAKFVGKMDSGQMVRFKPGIPGRIQQAYEAQIGGDTGTLMRIDADGPRLLFRNKDNSVPQDTWFTQEVIAKGNRLIVMLNGETVVDISDDKYRSGQLALQSFNNQGTVYFRKIEIKELPPTPEEPRWVELFNGKDTNGWIVPAPGTGKGEWHVDSVNGQLAGFGSKSSYVFTARDDYQDFHLKTEVSCTGGVDSAIFFRCGKELLHDEFPAGYQVDTGFLKPHKFGALLLTTPEKKTPTVLFDPSFGATMAQFHPLELIVRGKRIVIRVDGKIVTDFTDDRATYRKGRIALQVASPNGTGAVHYKKIEIKELSASDHPFEDSNRDRPDAGWLSLFNGKDTTGWKKFGAAEATGGELVVSPHSAVDTIDRLPRFFHLRMNVKFDLGNAFGHDGYIRFHAQPRETSQTTPEDGWMLSLNKEPGGQVGAVLFPTNPGLPGGGSVAAVRTDFADSGKWLDLDIVAKGVDTEVRVNGESKLRLAGKHAPGVLSFDLTNSGPQSRMTFRRIEIKDLTHLPDEPRYVISGTPRLRKTIDVKGRTGYFAFGADAKSLMVADESLKFLDVVSGEVIHEDKLPAPASAPLSLSKDRKTLAVVHKDAAIVFDLPARKVPLQSKSGLVYSVALSPDAKTLAYGADKSTFFLDRSTGKSQEDARYGRLWSLKYSPDGRFFIGVSKDNELVILDAATRDLIAKKPVGVMGLTDISQDSKRLVVTGTEGKEFAFFVYDLPDCNLLYKETSLPKTPDSVSFSPDGAYLALGLITGEAQIWDIAGKRRIASWTPGIAGPFAPTFVAFSPDGKTLATGNGNFIRLWDLIPAEPGWTQLFNGADLNGWATEEGGKGNWQVADGAITCSGPKDYLYTKRDDFGDFHLRAEVKINDEGNSGIYFRAGKPIVDRGDVANRPYEAQITNAAGQAWKTGSLWGLSPAGEQAAVGPDTWFTYEIIAVGNRIRLLVNGKETANYQDPRPDRRAKGHIALQHLDARTHVYFRKIEIKELPPENAEWTRLFNGKDLTGWKSDPVEKGRTWYVKDGLLGLKGSEKRTLFSERDDFRDFRLRIEAKYTAKAKPATVGLHAPYGVEDWGGVRCVGTGIGEDAGNVFVGFRHSTRTKAPRLEPGAWFTQEWIFKGTGLTVKLNGEELSTQDDVMEKLAQGHILFTLPPDNLVIRKIEIKEFGPSTGGDSK